MNETIQYIPLIAGLWLVTLGLITKTEDVPSSLLFNGFSISLGVGCIYTACVNLGWLIPITL